MDAGARPGLQVDIRRLDPDLPLPRYARPDDAGLDLVARDGVTLAPGHRSLIATGIAVALPAGYAAFVMPRSGLAARHGITTLNSPGTVDAGYRGEILVNLVNLDPRETFVVRRGDRIAQLVVQRVENVILNEVDELPASVRGTGGHGASGGFGAQTQGADPTIGDRTTTAPGV